MNFKAVFQKINLNWSRKLTHNVTLPNVEFRTSWCTCSQNPSLVYLTPSELSAILCELCSQKWRFFLVQWNFPLYTRGVLGCLLGFWLSGPKPCGGNYLIPAYGRWFNPCLFHCRNMHKVVYFNPILSWAPKQYLEMAKYMYINKTSLYFILY